MFFPIFGEKEYEQALWPAIWDIEHKLGAVLLSGWREFAGLDDAALRERLTFWFEQMAPADDESRGRQAEVSLDQFLTDHIPAVQAGIERLREEDYDARTMPIHPLLMPPSDVMRRFVACDKDGDGAL
ncbi:MAG: hypothetical protein JXR94_16770 [Candidatus Hydrogenedentes bacterium]|nr:hypothetical protein [Candidatus Hydrogenedentota bacterium]